MESEKRRDTGCDGKGEHRRGCAKKETHLFLFPLPRGTKFRNCHTHFTSVSKCELRATRSTSTCGLQVHGSFCVMSSVCVAFVGKGMNYEQLQRRVLFERDEPATPGDLRCPPRNPHTWPTSSCFPPARPRRRGRADPRPLLWQ